MWTSTLDLNFRRILLTRLLGQFWSGAYFSSFAPLRVQQLPRQPLAASNWVRVRNRLAGISGNDLQLVHAHSDLRIAPATLPQYKNFYPGREVVGEVLEVGDEVQHLQVGDRVVLQYGPNCVASGLQNLCRSCSEGCYNLCENTTLPAPTQIGGGWSEEMLIAEQQLFRVPNELSDEQAVLLEACAVAVHAVLRHLPLPGERVLVIGAGTIGLLTLQVIRALAPQAEISVLARHPFQVEQATRMGAAHIIYPQDSYLGIQRVTHAQIHRGIPGNQTLVGGYDAIFDTVGRRRTLHHALRWSQTRATIVLVGMDLHLMHIDLTPIWHQELNLLGTRAHDLENWPLGTQEQHSSFEVALELIEKGYLHPEFLITHHYALNNYQNAITTASSKAQSRSIKVVFDYSLLPALVVPNVRASARRRRPTLSPDSTEDQLLETQEQEQEQEQEDTEDQQQLVPSHSSHSDPSQYTPVQDYEADKKAVPAHSQYHQYEQQPTIEVEEQPVEAPPQHDPHAIPTLREEAFLSHQPYDEGQDWTAPEPSFEDDISSTTGQDYDEPYINETKSTAATLSAPDNAQRDFGRNPNRQRNNNNKKNNRR